ncbi:MAG TPA: DUF4193 family protein [Mycobacteriales bacterium]|jgi:hypothetical protein|nr:DUF4193 family protein [Mycobacteriales bacterium]
MTTDYDAPRRGVELLDADPEVTAIGGRARGPDVDAPEVVDGVELPGGDLSGEELIVVVEPMRTDEFRCDRCFLVQSRHLVGEDRRGSLVCRDCAA